MTRSGAPPMPRLRTCPGCITSSPLPMQSRSLRYFDTRVPACSNCSFSHAPRSALFPAPSLGEQPLDHLLFSGVHGCTLYGPIVHQLPALHLLSTLLSAVACKRMDTIRLCTVGSGSGSLGVQNSVCVFTGWWSPRVACYGFPK